ncbi:MAG: HD domain-containing protein [Treponema sp.]|jgi:hypothetical protein|nr:HD domain-containing protein [Treponema sp.]
MENKTPGNAPDEIYTSFLGYAEFLITHCVPNKDLDIGAVTEEIKKICNALKATRRSFMHSILHAESAQGENYLSSHLARSAVIAIVIGAYLRLPIHRLIELGIAALLHDIGMTKIPSKLHSIDRALTEQERKLIYTHPIHGYKFLEPYNLSPAVKAAILEHHEREDGSGYPRKLTGGKITLYAKIIAVACSYEASTAKRHYKENKNHHTGLVELLKNENKQYDNTIVQALVNSLSLYPIGLKVLLSDGKQAQVHDVNPEDPHYPVVELLGKSNTLVHTSPETIFIARPLSHEEITESESIDADTLFQQQVKPCYDKIREIKTQIKRHLVMLKKYPKEAAGLHLDLAEERLNLAIQKLEIDTISRTILEASNEDALDYGRKSLYRCVAYLEAVVTDIVDAPFSHYEEKLAEITYLDAVSRYRLIEKLGKTIEFLLNAYGDNSKWKWPLVELEGRFAVVAKNILDLKKAAVNTDPSSPHYEHTKYHLVMTKELLHRAAERYRERYEMSTKHFADFQKGINFLSSLYRLHTTLGEENEAELVKKKNQAWTSKLETDQKRKNSTMKISV